MPSPRRSKQKSAGHARQPRVSQSRVRVIAGKWRGRWIDFPDADGLRPTGDRMRETLFNWLQPELAGAICLDLFAGSGALGIEAVSRGAARATLNDSNAQVAQNLQTQVDRFEGEKFEIVCTDAQVLIGDIAQSGRLGTINLAFVDPPFAVAKQLAVLEALAQSQILADQASVYVEAPAAMEIESQLPQGFQVFRSRTQAQVQCQLLRWNQAA